MRIKLTSSFVDDLDKALLFCSDLAGFIGRRRIPVEKYHYVTA